MQQMVPARVESDIPNPKYALCLFFKEKYHEDRWDVIGHYMWIWLKEIAHLLQPWLKGNQHNGKKNVFSGY